MPEKRREEPLRLRPTEDSPPEESSATGVIVDFLEKQQGVGHDEKLDDPPPGIIMKPRQRWCTICHGNTDHWHRDCPNKEKGMGKFCLECKIPCTNECENKHPKKVTVMLKWCGKCGSRGSHWKDDCWTRDAPAKVFPDHRRLRPSLAPRSSVS